MRPLYFALLTIGVLLSSTVIFSQALADTHHRGECGTFEVSEYCGMSNTMQMLLGDILIGILLSVGFYLFSEKNNRAIKYIVQRDFEQANKRKDFAVRNLKGTVNILLFTMGLIKKLSTLYNKEGYVTPKGEIYKKITHHSIQFEHFLSAARNSLFYSSDVLEPNIIYQIEHACLFLNQLEVSIEGGVATYSQYAAGKEKLQYIYRVLNTYQNSTHTFTAVDENEVFNMLKD